MSVRRVLMTLDAVGGVWRYALDAAEGLRRYGIETRFVGQGPRPGDLQCAEFRDRKLCEPIWIDGPLDWMAADEAELDDIGPRLLQLAAGFGADVLHLNLPSQAVGLPRGMPVVAMSHSCVGTWWQAVRGTPPPEEWRWRLRRNREGLAAADRVITPTVSHGAALADLYGPIEGLTTIFNGSSGAASAAPRRPLVFAAGRWWDDGKNGKILAEAAPYIDWPILVAGPMRGPNGETRELTGVEALGGLSPPALAHCLASAGIVVAPSLYEPFGLVVLESALTGAPLALSDIPVFRELWSEAALFFDPHDPHALAATLNRLAGDADLRAEMGRQAARAAAAYSIERQAASLVATYEATVAGHCGMRHQPLSGAR